jgi:ketosteroid isomerase-like protein
MTDSTAHVVDWVRRYERAWRSPGIDALADLFSDDVVYVPSPWARPIHGITSLGRFWEGERESADEAFTMTHDVVAVDGQVAVARIAVDYGGGERWRDLWVITFDDDGRCRAFEEWPFAPGQDDGHEPIV